MWNIDEDDGESGFRADHTVVLSGNGQQAEAMEQHMED